MMRSLWTASSGMTSQQMNVDVISHNLANVNTTAYKKERLEFKSLLYQNMNKTDKDPNADATKPVNLAVGLGVYPSSTARSFDIGNFEASSNPLDLALSDEGFFAVLESPDNVAYTRDGSFKISPSEEGSMLVTSDGFPLLDTENQTIILPPQTSLSSLSISENGVMSYEDENGESATLDAQIAIHEFPNQQGLEAMGKNLFVPTSASGENILVEDGANRRTQILQRFLEMSNVSVANEMVKLIVAQRAYELNSKAITTSDDMLQQATNLKR